MALDLSLPQGLCFWALPRPPADLKVTWSHGDERHCPPLGAGERSIDKATSCPQLKPGRWLLPAPPALGERSCHRPIQRQKLDHRKSSSPRLQPTSPPAPAAHNDKSQGTRPHWQQNQAGGASPGRKGSGERGQVSSQFELKMKL